MRKKGIRERARGSRHRSSKKRASFPPQEPSDKELPRAMFPPLTDEQLMDLERLRSIKEQLGSLPRGLASYLRRLEGHVGEGHLCDPSKCPWLPDPSTLPSAWRRMLDQWPVPVRVLNVP